MGCNHSSPVMETKLSKKTLGANLPQSSLFSDRNHSIHPQQQQAMGCHHSSPVKETKLSKKTLGANLPAEVLIVVFEELNRMSPRNFSRLRLVSRQVGALIVPIMYRHLVLTRGIVACFGKGIKDKAQLQVAQDVRHYTKEIDIDDYRLSLLLVGKLLRSLKDLRCLSWSIIELFRYSSFVLEDISPIFRLLCERWPNAKLTLTATASIITIARDLPLLQLASCKIVDNSHADYLNPTAARNCVARFLEASTNLQRLHLVAGSTRTHVNTRIPAIRELVLQDYGWEYDPTAGPLQWDLSKLAHLELKNMIIAEFLEEVRPDQLPQLRSFKTDSCGQSPDCDSWILCKWISELSSLESLGFKCNLWLPEYLDVIEKHALTLRALDISDDTRGDIDDDGAWHWEHADKLLMITDLRLRLRRLTLGIDANLLTFSMNQSRSTFEPPGTTNLLAQFRDLRYLTLVAYQPYIAGLQANRERNRLTHGAARKLIEELVTEKMGVRLEEVVIRMLVARSVRVGYYEERGLAHSTYTYEGGRNEDDTLSIREDMHKHSQQHAEVSGYDSDRS